eukprot:CCRYP_008868-RA/>CCRYP_008868-RA protein AED:0.02 eAED:0.02 QI:73/1/1/1/1/1/2/879/289
MMRLARYAQAAAILARGTSLTSNAFTLPPLPKLRHGRSSSRASTTDENVEAKRREWSRPELQGQSLISETLSQLENDAEFQEMSKQLADIGREGMTRMERIKRREERAKRRRALDELGIPNFMEFVTEKEGSDAVNAGTVRDGQLFRSQPTILQLNIGLYCNQACSHCHVESSPLRKAETMSAEVAARCLELLQSSPSVDTLDLTGGAPELNAQFRFLVKMARGWAHENRRKLTIIDRCNLTVLLEPGQEDLVEFLKDNQVKVVASLPCYGEANVDAQRGMLGKELTGS